MFWGLSETFAYRMDYRFGILVRYTARRTISGWLALSPIANFVLSHSICPLWAYLFP